MCGLMPAARAAPTGCSCSSLQAPFTRLTPHSRKGNGFSKDQAAGRLPAWLGDLVWDLTNPPALSSLGTPGTPLAPPLLGQAYPPSSVLRMVCGAKTLCEVATSENTVYVRSTTFFGALSKVATSQS